MPRTSTLLKVEIQIAFFIFLDLQDNHLRWSHFAFLDSSSSVWDGLIFCGGGGGGGNRMSLTLNPDLVCFLLGEIGGRKGR